MTNAIEGVGASGGAARLAKMAAQMAMMAAMSLDDAAPGGQGSQGGDALGDMTQQLAQTLQQAGQQLAQSLQQAGQQLGQMFQGPDPSDAGGAGGVGGVGGAQGAGAAGGAQGGLLQMIMQLLQMLQQLTQQGGDDDMSANPQAQNLSGPLGDSSAGDPGAVPGSPGVQGASAPGAVPGGPAPAGPAAAPPTDPVGAPAAAPPSGGHGMKGPANGKYDASIEKNAAAYGLNPDMVKCLINKESQGNPEAESSAGACGLGQLKPETASGLAGRQVSAEELKSKPDFNIQLTCQYLQQLSKQKNDSIPDILGAYNQGPNADWQSIPESQDYVKSIMNGMASGQLPTWG